MKYQKGNVKKKNTFYNCAKKKKYLGINLAKKAKDLNAENYETLIQEIKGDSKKGKGIPCSWIGRINIVKWPYYPKQSTDLMRSLTNYP